MANLDFGKVEQRNNCQRASSQDRKLKGKYFMS